MNTACLPDINVEDVELNLKPSLTLVLIYEDARSRERLSWVESGLLQQLGGAYDLRFAWWGLASLAIADRRRRSIKVAARANVVIFSLHAAHELSSLMKAWVDEWLGVQDRNRPVLMALLETRNVPSFRASPNEAYLRKITGRARIDFLPNTDESELISTQGLAPATPRTLFNDGDV